MLMMTHSFFRYIHSKFCLSRPASFDMAQIQQLQLELLAFNAYLLLCTMQIMLKIRMYIDSTPAVVCMYTASSWHFNAASCLLTSPSISKAYYIVVPPTCCLSLCCAML